jgi:rhodanese-related sulfurtransferase
MKINRNLVLRRTMATMLVLLGMVVFVLGSAQAQSAKPQTLQEMVATATANITTVALPQGKFYFDSKTLFVDVREPDEFKKGHVPAAVNIPRGLLEFQITNAVPDKTTRIVVYCKSGARSALSTETLQKMGYTNAVSMSGGWEGWAAAGYPAEN